MRGRKGECLRRRKRNVCLVRSVSGFESYLSSSFFIGKRVFSFVVVSCFD